MIVGAAWSYRSGAPLSLTSGCCSQPVQSRSFSTSPVGRCRRDDVAADLRDVDAMLATSRKYKKAVVIGGGLLGLEVANGLLQQGMFVTVVHRYHTLMERQLDEAASTLLRVTLEDRGVTFRMSATAAAVLGSARVSGVRLDDGTELDADLVVMAVGIRPSFDSGGEVRSAVRPGRAG